MLRISDQAIYNWAIGWRTHGLAGILTGHKGGRPPKLTADMLDAAADIARAEPLTLAKIAARVRALYPDAPSFSLDRLSAGLKARRLSFKRTRLSLKKRNEVAFLQEKCRLIKCREAAKERKIELLYCDENGFSCVQNVQRAWLPIGVTHLADTSVGRKRVNVIGALDYATGALHFELFEHSVKRQHVVPFLDKLAQSSSRDKITIVVMDNASIHHFIDPEMRDKWQYVHLFMLLYLPPYGPELNLIEILWKHAKYHWRSFTSWSKDSLAEEVSTLFKGVGSDFYISYA